MYVQRSADTLCKRIKAERTWPLPLQCPTSSPWWWHWCRPFYIRLSIHSSNIIDITMCKVLGARVKKTSKQFFFQGAHRLEGETYILILQCQVECAIDTASWLSTAFRARLPVFESQSLVNHVTLKGSYLISLSSISSSAKWGCLSW